MKSLGSLLLVGVGLGCVWTASAGAVTAKSRYSPYDKGTIDIYLPSGAGPFPAVLAIHGGAWVGGASGDLEAVCEGFAARGIACFSADYRLMDKDGKIDLWPTQVQDVQTAMRWIRTQSATYHLSSKLCTLGVSVGGQLALWLGSLPTIDKSYTARTDPEGETRLYPTESPQADCVVDISGPGDLPALTTRLIDYAKRLTRDLTPATVSERLAAASPINALSAGVTSPTLIIQGRHDDIVDPAQAVLLANALDDLEVTTDLIWTGAGHVFDGLSKAEIDALIAQSIAFVQAN